MKLSELFEGAGAEIVSTGSTARTIADAGLPVTQSARQVSGPRLRGSGDVSDTRFSAAPTTGIGEFATDANAPGDAADPRDASAVRVPQMDLKGSSVTTDGTNLQVHLPVADLSNLASPAASSAGPSGRTAR